MFKIRGIVTYSLFLAMCHENNERVLTSDYREGYPNLPPRASPYRGLFRLAGKARDCAIEGYI